MKGKYITLNIMMVCTKKNITLKKSIHEQLEETIAERKRIMQQLERYTRTARMVEMFLTDMKAA
jgi:hypothetical protein